MSVSAFIIIILFKCMVFFSYNNRFWIDYFFLAMCHNEEKYQTNLNNLPFCLYKYRAQKNVIILEYFQIWFIWWMMVLIFYSTSRHLLISFRSYDKWLKMDRSASKYRFSHYTEFWAQQKTCGNWGRFIKYLKFIDLKV